MKIFSKKERAGNQRRIFHKDTVRQAFWRALPIMGSYLFVSMSYGLLMQEAGYRWGWSLLVSVTVYTGAFQFVLITFLSSGASLLTIGLTALFVTIFVDQWKAAKSHIPALLGLGCGVVLLLAVGQDYFLLPTLILVSGILLAVRGKMSGEVMEDE